MDHRKLVEFAFEKVRETKLPGLSLALVRGDEVVWQGAMGLRDLERGLPATPHTLYGIGSVTKSFTALAIMQLAEEGKLSLDDPVEEYLPFPRAQGVPPRIEHLLSHTSGIPALAYAEAVIREVVGAGGSWLPIGDVDDLVAFMEGAEDWAVARPGERWFYLNEGYAVLGAIVQRVSGLPYQEYVRRHILEPLGMDRSFFRREEVEADPDVAVPYVITREGKRLPSRYPYGAISADGGLISSVLDLAKYLSLYLGRGEAHGARLLAPEGIREMETIRVKLSYQGPLGEVGYGYGLQVVPDFLGRTLVGHGGSVLVSTAYLGYVPEEGVGIALLANGSGYPLSQLGMYGLALLLGEDPDALPFVRQEAALAELTGTYETFKGTVRVLVRRKGDLLSLEISDKYIDLIVPLIPESLDGEVRKFYALERGRRIPVEFRPASGGIVLLYERYLFRRTGELP
ncbi:serine hydrolase [Candidatus Acetothermia bacterium]|nr:MAG: serine hydrolase [Candidatus Acetothermia bacterium]